MTDEKDLQQASVICRSLSSKGIWAEKWQM